MSHNDTAEMHQAALMIQTALHFNEGMDLVGPQSVTLVSEASSRCAEQQYRVIASRLYGKKKEDNHLKVARGAESPGASAGWIHVDSMFSPLCSSYGAAAYGLSVRPWKQQNDSHVSVSSQRWDISCSCRLYVTAV